MTKLKEVIMANVAQIRDDEKKVVEQLQEEIEEEEAALKLLTVENMKEHEEERRLRVPKRPSPMRHPLRLGTKRESPTFENTFGWSSTYVPFFDKHE